VTEEMSGGLRHHNDEENGPSHAVGYQSSKKHDRYSLERNHCVCADVKCVPQNYKSKKSSPLTRPTSLEMLLTGHYTRDFSTVIAGSQVM
jgi:hypothetical protein